MMKDSNLDVNWLRQMMAANPCGTKLVNEQGAVTYLTGPVRLSFVNLFEKGKPQARSDGSTGEGKYGATILFPLGADLSKLNAAWAEQTGQIFPEYRNAATGQFVGLHTPFRDQVEKTVGNKPLSGFTPGAFFTNVSTNFKPSVVDPAMNVIIDKDRAYPGVWAICALNTYAFGKNPPQPRKGVGFGLQTVMIIAEDKKLSGGGVDPAKAFAGVQISAGVDVAGQFALASGAGHAGTLPIQAVETPEQREARELAELMG